ncbi:unnamed protein product [Microthlaspi erraticum]|uniref:Uncharacterized protein n=1 Tax=Microthlaspi erraticum TaxID=1685480 RepID=A0A6D2JIQ8_9BRAS|nr:unnamed protein product [Microthlaspi erraticum]
MIRNQAASTVPSGHARNTIRCDKIVVTPHGCDKIVVTPHGKPYLPQSQIRNTSYQQPGKQQTWAQLPKQLKFRITPKDIEYLAKRQSNPTEDLKGDQLDSELSSKIKPKC